MVSWDHTRGPSMFTTIVLLAVALPSADRTLPAVQKWIEQLASDEPAVSTPAEEKLTKVGHAAIDPLREYARVKADVHARLRAVAIAAAIEQALTARLRKFEGHTDGVIVFAVSPDGKQIASASCQAGGEHVVR